MNKIFPQTPAVGVYFWLEQNADGKRMGASARDAHVISPRSWFIRSGFDCRRAPIGATLYSPGSKAILHERKLHCPSRLSEQGGD
jgi:hypothetical protein